MGVSPVILGASHDWRQIFVRRKSIEVVINSLGLLSHQHLGHGLQGLDAVFGTVHELRQDLPVLRLVEESELKALWLHGRLLLKPSKIPLLLTGCIIVLLRSQAPLFLVPRRLDRVPTVVVALILVVDYLRQFLSNGLLLFLALREIWKLRGLQVPLRLGHAAKKV